MDNLGSVLQRLDQERRALGHFNVSDFVLLKAVLAAAGESKTPIVIGASEGERDFFGTRQLAALVKSFREDSDLPIFLNADHTHSTEKAVEAANAGFDAVVIDFSTLPFEQNVLHTKRTVEAIRSINPSIMAEGEIGYIGTGSEIHRTIQKQRIDLTTPEEAKQFVHSTGIDILAPAVGNMHGMVATMVEGKTKKRLDIQRIEQIKRATGIFLTLHGGSGTDDDDFRKAIGAGINIIHINTELRVAWRKSLDRVLSAKPDEVVPYKILPHVIDSVKEVVSSRLKLFNGACTTERKPPRTA